MSGTGEDGNKELQKAMPLDLARTQIATVRTADGKSSVVMTGPPVRGMRVLTPSSVAVSGSPTIITTNVTPSIFKQDPMRSQIANISSILNSSQTPGSASITVQRPTQITLATSSVVAQNTGMAYHVPRGPAVVANLAAPRSNVASVRAPVVVATQATGQTHAFVRPPRTPSPAQGTAWLTNTSNGSQIKGATTVLSSPVRGASVTGKPQLVSRTQSGLPNMSTIRSGAILQSAIIGQFKTGQGATGIQTLGNAVTIAQVLPARTQAVVYNPNTSGQFTQAPRLSVAVANSAQAPKQISRPLGQVSTTTRLTIPVNVSQPGARLVGPQATVLTSGTRITAVPSQQSQPTVIGSTATRIGPSQPNVTVGRISVASAPAQVSTANILGQARTFNFQTLVAVTNAQQARNAGAYTQATKVVAQSSQANVPTAVVHPRQSVVSSQAIPIANVYSQQGDTQQVTPTASVFIHAATAVPRKASPGPNIAPQMGSSGGPAGNSTTYTLPSGTYFYDGTGNYSVARSLGQQSTSFAAISQSPQPVKPTSINTQVHGIVASQQMRFNPVMVVDQNRTQQFSTTQSSLEMAVDQPQSLPTKITSSPRPSILRKRDHEGSPLKAAKNLTPVLANMPQQQQQQVQTQPPMSPPSRPDSRGNGHSSGGSTTISATSSPGLTEVNEDSMPHVPMNHNKDDDMKDVKPPMEMSPRKKPRKQQLTGNDIDEHNDDMQFISDNAMKREPDDSDGNQSDELRDGAPEAKQVTTVRKPASASLLNSYRQTWKATHNHYLRYSDVRPKDERRPTIMDLANQYRVQEKVNGWKIHHLSTQMEDLADQEQSVYSQLTDILRCTESHEAPNFEKDVNRINELIKGNLQRIKIINDGMVEAKTQILKIFDHKVHVTDIINRCASKRNFKKREKS